jgi:hypothetical protein
MMRDFQKGGGTMIAAIGKEFDARAAAMAERLEPASDVYRTTADRAGKPSFSPDLTADMTRRGRQHARTVAPVGPRSASLATWLSGTRALARHGEGKLDPYLMGKIKALRGRVDQFGDRE